MAARPRIGVFPISASARASGRTRQAHTSVAASRLGGHRGAGTPGRPATRPHQPRVRSSPRNRPRTRAALRPRERLECCQHVSYGHAPSVAKPAHSVSPRSPWELRARAGRRLRRLGARHQPLVVCGSGLSRDYGPVALPAAVGQWPLSLEAPRHPKHGSPRNVRSGQSPHDLATNVVARHGWLPVVRKAPVPAGAS